MAGTGKKSVVPEFLFEKYGLVISRVARRMIQNVEIAREAAQEVWYEIFRNIGSFRSESDISTWIFTIARRTLLRYARKERVYKNREINEFFAKDEIQISDQPERDREELIKEMCDNCLTAFCHCLTNEARLIYLLRVVSGLHYSVIAEVMEMEESSVRKKMSRSTAKVRHFMNRNCVLFNPSGECRCRIQKNVRSIDIPKIYSGLSRTMKLVDFYMLFDKELPRKSFWEKKLEKIFTN
jgi:RNA polymerase sigma factor (sigma-70 family)